MTKVDYESEPYYYVLNHQHNENLKKVCGVINNIKPNNKNGLINISLQTFKNTYVELYISSDKFKNLESDLKVGLIIQIEADLELSKKTSRLIMKNVNEVIIISTNQIYVDVCQYYTKKIDEYANYNEDDWDGNGSSAITKDLITKTMLFISQLKTTIEKNGLEFVYPFIATGDGELILEWRTEDFELSIDINEKSDVVEVVGWTPNSEYYEKWNQNKIKESFIEWILKEASK
jgi:hypothetical protein